MKRLKRNGKMGKLLFCFFVTTIITTVLTLSKYKSTTEGTSNTKIAFPSVELNSARIIETELNPDITEKQYIFSVSNKTEEKRTEVTMKYNIQINTLSDLPLQFELYTYNNNQKGETNLLQGNGNTTDYINFSFDEDKENQYMLVIKWNQAEKDYRYNNTIDYIQICANSVQVD